MALRETVAALFSKRTSDTNDRSSVMVAVNDAGFYESGFKVRPTSPATLQVTVDAGLGWFNDNLPISGFSGITGLDDPSRFKPLVLTTLETIVVPAADPVNPRIDIVEVRLNRLVGDPTSRDVLNPSTGIFAPASVNKTLSYSNSPASVNGAGGINYKTGTPAGVPVAPSVSAGYVKISEVRVEALVATIAENKIKDLRNILLPANNQYIVSCFSAGAGINRINTPPGVLLTQLNGPGQIRTIAAFAGSPAPRLGPLSAVPVNINTLLSPLQVNDFGVAVVDTAAGLVPISLISPVASVPIKQSDFAAATPPLQVAIGQPFAWVSYQPGTADATIPNFYTSMSLSR
jgi:hypothetical protein